MEKRELTYAEKYLITLIIATVLLAVFIVVKPYLGI